LDLAGWSGPRTYASKLDVDASERVGVLVMADGSARHRMLAPEWADVEGRAFDAAVAKALADGDASALAGLDLVAAETYKSAGVAGLVALGETCEGARIAAQLRYDGAPFDVGYWVADWHIEPR
jgi:aromatic ring-opening dioxygenase LigB subunit